MHLEIEHDGQRTAVELRDGIFTFGGSPADAVHLPGAPGGVFAALIDGDRVIVEADESLSFDGVLSPRQVRRLWLPMERIVLGERVSLRRLAEPTAPRSDGTVAVVHELFDGVEGPSLQMPRLICLTGLDLGRVFPITDGTTEIGRGDAVGLRIRDRAVSRRHARLIHERGETRLEDLGTPNGVYVRGRRVRGSVRLRDGDVVEIGRALLKFVAPPQVESAAEPPPAPAEPPPASAEPRHMAAPAADAAPDAAPPPRVQETTALPSSPRRSRAPSEWWMTAGAVAMAVAGALATWRITA